MPNPTVYGPSATFPSLHDKVLKALSGAIDPVPSFQASGPKRGTLNTYSTHVMATFRCHNQSCDRKGWDSKKVNIVISGYPNNGYKAVVFNQRCKACEKLGAMRMDDESYVERVAYRLKRWANIEVARPVYTERKGPEHESELCEGCKRGYCMQSKQRDWY